MSFVKLIKKGGIMIPGVTGTPAIVPEPICLLTNHQNHGGRQKVKSASSKKQGKKVRHSAYK